MTPIAVPTSTSSARPAPDEAEAARLEELTLALHGVVIRITTNLPGLIDGVRATWGGLTIGEGMGRTAAGGSVHASISLCEEDGALILRQGDGRAATVSAGSPLVVVFDRIVDALTRGLDDRGILAIHAGAVEIDGRATILAGQSERGKSTLVLELVRGGAGLLSDECALVAPNDRTILPYPRSIHLRPATLALFDDLRALEGHPRRDLGGGSEVALAPARVAELLGGHLATDVPLGCVVLLGERLAPDAEPRLEPTPTAIAAMELLRGTTAASWNLGRARDRLIDILDGVPCASLRAGDLRATGALVTAWARGSA